MMTSQLHGEAATSAGTLLPAISLADRVTSRLLAEITRGRFRAGDRLPTEHRLAAHFGVSRTVIREAVGRLKADGLVVSRQGSGVFVARNPPAVPFRIDRNMVSVLELVELRMGFDVEAAGLAAERRTNDQLQVMSKALDEMASAIDRGHDGVDADMAFHRAVCIATGNPYFVTFIQFLEQYLRESLKISRNNSARRVGFAARAQAEHQAIFDAIAARDPELARNVAREHVTNTAKRLATAADGP